MAADASIYNLIRPVQPGPGPLQNYGQAMQLRALIDDQGLKAMQRQQLERGMADEDAVRQIEMESMGDPAKMREGFSKRGLYKQRMDLEKRQSEAGKADAEAMKIDRENFVGLMDAARKRMAAVRDPQSWQAFRDEQIQLAGMFKTPAIRETAMRAAQSMPAEFNPNYIRDSLVKAEELFTPRMIERTDGQRKWMEDTNPFTNPAIRNQAPTQMKMTPGESATDARGRTANSISAGNLQVSRDRLRMDQNAPPPRIYDADRGVVVNTQDGTASPVLQGGNEFGGGRPLVPKGNEKPLTDVQGAATAFGMRAAESNRILSALEDGGVKDTGIIRSAVSGTLGLTPFMGDKLESATSAAMNVLPLVGPSGKQQQTEQARRDFVNAVLRKESGAVIAPSEFDNASKQYFPQPGDDKATVAQKRRNREMAIRALGIQAGPGAKNIQPTSGATGGWKIERE